MRFYLVAKAQSRDTVRRFQKKAMVQVDSKNMWQFPYGLKTSGSLSGQSWAIFRGDVELAQLALVEYNISNETMIDVLRGTRATKMPQDPLDERPRHFSWVTSRRFEMESYMTPAMLAVLPKSIDMLKLVHQTWDSVFTVYNSRVHWAFPDQSS
ncbi:hypothetical protein N657DRAFT_186288 [Parathielavia appendiculata]|uniref:Uncharacterized protein n=1 Tax=Parathielavia appendiculata TaxID=2587402 RepID=A0AAN6U5Z8_9PEZI|nr:hypothetical protein N657DRAFT_186288 [Parathielavia appendiculata]